MSTIYEARSFIRANLNKEVFIKVIGLRNKSSYIDGIISECYRNVFIVDTGKGKKSFSYSDVLIGNILVKVK